MKEMKNNKETWKEEVMQSLDSIEEIEPSSILWSRLENKLNLKPNKIILISNTKIWAVAASTIFLLGINIFVLSKSYNHFKRNPSEILIEAYQLNTNAEIQIP